MINIIKKQKTQISIGLVALAGVGMFSFQNCSRVSFVSAPEQQVLNKTDIFKFDPNSRIAGVKPSDGLPLYGLSQDLSETPEDKIQLAKDCTTSVKLADGTLIPRKEYERLLSIDEWTKDKENLIPVEYAISYGDKLDVLADWAHRRAILSSNNPGVSYIPIGGKSTSANDGYYIVNHDKAKAEYIAGQRCYFNTVKLKDYVANQGYFKFVTENPANGGQVHAIHYMYYGYCAGDCATGAVARYGAGNYGSDEYPNRLFAKWPHTETVTINGAAVSEPQFVKLYVADIRSKHLSPAIADILRIKTGTVRGVEKSLDVRDMVNLPAVNRDLGQMIRNLSSDINEGGIIFAHLDGVPQLITNLFAGVAGTNLSSQYTPIVLDLGQEKVRTSSVFGGTFFNMASLKRKDVTGDQAFDVKHITSWLGGEFVNVNPAIKDGKTYKFDYRRVSDDGFLVIPDADGKVRSSRNLFGDNLEVDGKTYENGFLALQALAKKDCQNGTTKDKYFGPWDGELYSSKIKVWIDANRNGEAEDSEVKSLESLGVLAINTCNFLHTEAHDIFGNGTSLRSAFLYRGANDSAAVDEKEILSRIETGLTSKGVDAQFRLAIDLIFKVDEKRTLEKYGDLIKPVKTAPTTTAASKTTAAK